MAARTSFGKRLDLSPTVQVMSAAPVSPSASSLDDAYDNGLPILTLGLIAILAIIFAAELRLMPSAQWLSPNSRALVALGGVDGKLVLDAGQWWRLFTAPLLHASPSHLVGNCIALFFAGLFLEPMIGAGWFALLFFASALAGSAGSLAQNDPNLVSVGASGAIMGLFAATLLCSGREKDPGKRRRMQWIAGRILVFSVGPIFLSSASGDGTDYGAHAGGAMAGVALWIVIAAVWERGKRPPLQNLAAGIAGTLAICAVAGFALADGQQVHAATGGDNLVPESRMPANDEEGVRRSAELIADYPSDPRARYYRAMFFYAHQQLGDAAEQLRAALSAYDRHPSDFNPQFRRNIQMGLGLTLAAEGDMQDGRETARDSCAASPKNSHLRQDLQRFHICD